MKRYLWLIGGLILAGGSLSASIIATATYTDTPLGEASISKSLLSLTRDHHDRHVLVFVDSRGWIHDGGTNRYLFPQQLERRRYQ